MDRRESSQLGGGISTSSASCFRTTLNFWYPPSINQRKCITVKDVAVKYELVICKFTIPIFVNWKFVEVLQTSWIVVFYRDRMQQWTLTAVDDKSSRTIMRWFTWYFPSGSPLLKLWLLVPVMSPYVRGFGGSLQILNELRKKLLLKTKYFSLSLTELKWYF